jgi:hypothetical protein
MTSREEDTRLLRRPLTRREFLRVSAVAGSGIALAACGAAGTSGASSGATTAPASSGNAMDQLIAAAKAEGQLTTIALPHTWLN